jgi:glycosyltransferase involved in cell wall biosynthesis
MSLVSCGKRAGVTPPIVSRQHSNSETLKVAVGIASVGRPGLLSEMLCELEKQTRQPDCILVSHSTDDDVLGIRADSENITYIRAPLGLTRQRNAILKFAEGFDVVVFLDDDFFPEPKYLEVVERVFQSNESYQIVTGTLLADGIKGPGIAPSTARSLIENDRGTLTPLHTTEVYNGYGCNLAVRLASIYEHGIFFDEELPLYGWLEDVDFSRRVAPTGKIVRVDGARGVHLGAKFGRTSGVRLGYSQIANPTYMVRRGTFSRPRAFEQMLRNVLSNVSKAMFPEPNIDRAGRFRGNLIALRDLMLLRCHPKRILDLN